MQCPCAVDSPPGRISASIPSRSAVERTSLARTPGCRSTAATCSLKPPWTARTPTANWPSIVALTTPARAGADRSPPPSSAE
eukprot:scaffold93685_cov24-Tisochrysis_lutea.AAC.2